MTNAFSVDFANICKLNFVILLSFFQIVHEFVWLNIILEMDESKGKCQQNELFDVGALNFKLFLLILLHVLHIGSVLFLRMHVQVHSRFVIRAANKSKDGRSNAMQKVRRTMINGLSILFIVNVNCYLRTAFRTPSNADRHIVEVSSYNNANNPL